MDKIYLNYTLAEAQERVGRPVPTKHSSDASQSDSSWHGGSYKYAVQKSLEGDRELAQEIEDAARELSAGYVTAEHISLAPIVGVAGSVVDVGEYLDGNPECMTEYVLGETQSRVAYLTLNIASASGVSESIIRARATALCVIAQALEASGYSVGINVVMNVVQYCITVTIKEPGQYVDPCVVAYWIAGKGAYRRLFFRLVEIQGEKEREHCRVGSSYGQCAELKSSEREQGLYVSAATRAQSRYARDHLTEIIQKQGEDYGLAIAA